MWILVRGMSSPAWVARHLSNHTKFNLQFFVQTVSSLRREGAGSQMRTPSGTVELESASALRPYVLERA